MSVGAGVNTIAMLVVVIVFLVILAAVGKIIAAAVWNKKKQDKSNMKLFEDVPEKETTRTE